MAYRISIAGHDVSFPGHPSQSILDAAARAGIDLPHACRAGACGNCAGQVESGRVAGIGGAAPVNEFCEPGQVLFCACGPTSDIIIRPRSWRGADASERRKLTAKVFRNTLVAEDVSLLQLRLPAGQRVKFRAGQHLRIELPGGVGRFYSMANPPQESDSITLHVRHVKGGLFTSRVGSLCAGDTLKLELPLGDFFVPHDEDRPLVFVAVGTGFAPIKSIIDDFARSGLDRRMTLIWGARRPEGLYLPGAIDPWRKRWPHFRFVPAISGGCEAPLPGMFPGRVDAALAEHFRSLEGCAVYCCGSPAMVQSVLRATVRLGLPRADFHADAFVAAVS